MGAHRADQAPGVVGVAEGVDAGGVGRELGIVGVRGQHQWRTAAPPPEQLGRKLLLALGIGRVVGQEAAKRGDVGMDLAHAEVGSVVPECGRHRHGLRDAGLAGVAERELAGGDRWLGRCDRGAGQPGDVREAQPVAVPEVGAHPRMCLQLDLVQDRPPRCRQPPLAPTRAARATAPRWRP